MTIAISETSPSLGDSITLAPHVCTVPAPDAYGANGQDVGETFAAHVRAAIADMQPHGIKPTALLVDTIFSSDGVFAYPVGFLAPAIAEVRAVGGLFTPR